MSKLTEEHLKSLVTEETYVRPGNGTLTVAVLTIGGSTTVIGESNVLNPANFDPEIGRRMAYQDAIDKLWQLEGYHIKRLGKTAILRAAMAAHEANRALQIACGEDPSPHWKDAPEWMRQSSFDGALNVARTPGITPEASHANWCETRRAAGWTYGDIKSETSKTHPNLVPWDDLPPEQKAKDVAFVNVVLASLTN